MMIEIVARPRVGQVAWLKNGDSGDVMSVMKARDVVKTKTEIEAIEMGQRLSAIFGANWLDVYYEVTLLVGDALKVVSPMDIDRVTESH